MKDLEIYKRILPRMFPIILRNFLVLVNGIILIVIVLLIVFGSIQAGIFLALVFFLNTFIGVAQDIHAQMLLEKLQMLTALRVIRINEDKTEESILAENIRRGDLIKLKLGDQLPCDALLVAANNLELSLAMITGESDTFPKNNGEKVVAGSVITSGTAVAQSEGLYRESTLSKIAGEVRNYQTNPSSIQQAIGRVIKYSGYTLVAAVLYVVTRGYLLHLPVLEIVTNVGALASVLVPQGLIITVTVLFAVGAGSYARRNVLFQEINATEKLGQIRNICIDKTGTLTDNKLAVDGMYVWNGASEKRAKEITLGCISGMTDSSETVLSIKRFLESSNKVENVVKVIDSLTFSSWRRYAAAEIIEENISQTVFLGAPDLMIAAIDSTAEREWLQNIIAENSLFGKRVFCVTRATNAGLPKNLENIKLSVVAIFVFHNTLREGIQSAIKSFQDRGIKIRVLSGDNLNTVKSVAASVGILGAEKFVTGAEVELWSNDDFEKYAHQYTVFAQILPEHKVKLVEAFKKDGFTAMVGDGVNDALAMKKSDLGIAMFDGAPVTRNLADVILLTNSFADLPGAVELADHFTRSIEITSGIYINQALVGLSLFVILSSFGFSFPLAPLNITIINYFTVGFAGILTSYWALRPSGKIPRPTNVPFLKRVMPLVFACSVFQGIGLSIVFLISPEYLKTAASNTLVLFSFMSFGYIFLLFATKVYCGILTKKERVQILILGMIQPFILYGILQIPPLVRFFSITLPYPPASYFYKSLLVVLSFGFVQFVIVKRFFLKDN